MTGKQRDRGRSWQPLERAEHVPSKEALATNDLRIARVLKQELGKEIWRNNKYVVIVTRDSKGNVTTLSIRRDDRGHMRDWRDLQRIKNELAGEEVEAVELFPAESRLVDTANQTWLWCFPPGGYLPLGFSERLVQGPDEGHDLGQTQRPFT